jgi:hypothetical protein
MAAMISNETSCILIVAVSHRCGQTDSRPPQGRSVQAVEIGNTSVYSSVRCRVETLLCLYHTCVAVDYIHREGDGPAHTPKCDIPTHQGRREGCAKLVIVTPASASCDKLLTEKERPPDKVNHHEPRM